MAVVSRVMWNSENARDHADAAYRLAVGRRRGWGVRLKPRHVAAMVDRLDVWIAVGLPAGARRRFVRAEQWGVGVHLSSAEVAALALCGRCRGDGEWGPTPDQYPEQCPDCGGSGWGRAA